VPWTVQVGKENNAAIALKVHSRLLYSF